MVDRMGDLDAFVAILEFSPESAHTPLFRAHGAPGRLRAAEFSASRLQRTLKGQLGAQRFFSEAQRAFCCYVVLGGHRAVSATLPEVNLTLSSLIVHALVAS